MLYQQITKNKRKTVILLAIFVIILAIIGAVSGKIFYNSPIEGIMWSIFASVVYLLIGLANPASMIMRMNHAIEIKEQDDP
ncbi:MAG: zinc metalloprotease HtpX, partial [Lactobacillus iners]|nr:zinc metalloprotease HtpX [Lactobacillus iners]